MEQPLVSCIMPTRNRRDFVAQALHYFEQQDYPNKELVIVDDSDELIVDLIAGRPDVRYHSIQYIHTTGGKRNMACELSRGEIICHWDDDDWYSPTRLSYQVNALLASNADLNGLHMQSVFDIEHMQGWECTDINSIQPGVNGIHHGTLVYWRNVWLNRVRFQDTSKGEDMIFVRRLINLGGRVDTLPCLHHQVYIRHGRNGWKYRPGTTTGAFSSPELWHRVSPERCVPQEDMAYYLTMRAQLLQKRRANSKSSTIKRQLDRLLSGGLVPALSFKR